MDNEEYNLDNIDNFYNSLDSPYKKLYAWAEYKREKDRTNKRREIEAKYERKLGNYYYYAHLITDDIAIVEEVCCGKTTGYFAYLGNKSWKSNCRWKTFDEALLCALSIKYTGRENATNYVKKLLDWNDEVTKD